MKKCFMLFLAVLAVLALFVVSCGAKDSGSASGENVKEIAVILKATDSEFWQSMAMGARKYQENNPGTVNITVYGPQTEADIAGLVAILENVVSQNPDAILVAPPNADSIIASVNEAMGKGIPVVTADNSINTKVTAHIATDNIVGGSEAADALVAAIQAKGQALRGKVSIIAPDVFEVIDNRIRGFRERMAVIAPDVEIMDPRYCDNDIAKSLNISQDILLSTTDLIGFYGANNHSADGVARALRETGKYDVISTVAYDSDPEEIQALADGVINALVVQDPWALGYKGVEFLMQTLNGETVEEYFNPGVTVIKTDAMNEAKNKAILDPKLRTQY